MSSKQPTGQGRHSRAGSASEYGGDQCDIVIDTDLESVRGELLARLAVGEKLGVELRSSGGAFQSVVCLTADGAVVGAIAAVKGISDIINCLERGRRYEVQITSIEGATCHVLGGLVRQ